MILIVGNNDETTVHHVRDWLYQRNHLAMVIGYDEFAQCLSRLSISNEEENLELNLKGTKLQLKEIKAIWYRKSALIQLPDLSWIKEKSIIDAFDFHLKREILSANAGMITLFDSIPKLGNQYRNDLNKFIALKKAKEVGLDIPRTLLSTKKEDVKQFKTKEGKIITKSVQDSLNLMRNGKAYLLYTEAVEDEHFESVPDDILPSLFQEHLDKDYELRVFYLNGKCYSMAIFSQSDEQTATDFRVYNWKKMNRMIPYQLSVELENKIQLFMSKVQLSTGSIDLVKTNDSRFVFLEVNPVGQFGFVSEACNYYLEQKVADHLIQAGYGQN